MKIKLFSIILLISIFFTQITFAQIFYFSNKKTNNGLMIGVEIFDEKTKTAIDPKGFVYEWTLSDLSLESVKTYSNTLFQILNDILPLYFIDLLVYKPFEEKIFKIKNKKIFLNQSKAKIAQLSKDNVILPILEKLEKDSRLIVVTKDFSSQNLNYVWTINNRFISNQKIISLSDISEKGGFIKVKVYGINNNEYAEDSLVFKIE
jgi:hypothetical protein